MAKETENISRKKLCQHMDDCRYTECGCPFVDNVAEGGLTRFNVVCEPFDDPELRTMNMLRQIMDAAKRDAGQMDEYGLERIVAWFVSRYGVDDG